jgi:hypothetical protein
VRFRKAFDVFMLFGGVYKSFIGRLGQKVIPKAEKIEIW